MSRPADDGGNPYHASTDFEQFTHSEMLDMVKSADPAKVTALAHKLDSVSTQTEKIGTDLQTHMSKVDWQGPAGDAFRDWGSRVASATLTLSDYSSTAGVFMLNAGQVLSDVQRDMPKVPNLAYETVNAYRAANNIQGPFADTAGVTPDHLDGVQGPYSATPTAAQYQAASSTLETARSSAVDQMNKLGQAYNMATDVISTTQEPTFPPTPPSIMPARPLYQNQSSTYVPGSTGGTGTTGGSGSVPVQHFNVPTDNNYTTPDSSTSSPPSDQNQTLPQVPTPPDSSLNLDSFPPVPTPVAPTPVTPPVFPVAGPQPTPPPSLPVPMPSGFGPLPNLGPNSLNKVPDEEMPFNPRALAATRQELQQETEGLTKNLSTTEYNPIGGGRFTSTGRMAVPGLNEDTRLPGTRGLSAPSLGGTSGGRTPGSSGITGGRQRIAGGEGAENEEGAIPRGTVIGGGSGAGGRGRGGLHPTAGGIREESRKRKGGRRSGEEEEPEGVVGGTPSRDERHARRRARNFTSGGAGIGGERDGSTDEPGGETPHVRE